MQNEFARPVLTVSELLRSVRDTLERRFPLLWVKGELSNLSRAPSGHRYFTLKDRGAQVDCVMYRSRAAALEGELREGMQVEAQVLVSLYEPRGRFQLTVEALRPAGLGPLYERFLRLKEKLEREGLFDPAVKRALPAHPRTVGIVTSEVVSNAFNAIRKGGTVVVTGLADTTKTTIELPGALLTLFEKRIQGSLFGSGDPFHDIPRMVELYRSGDLKLDELITTTYTLDQVNQGYQDLLDGKNVRGVIVYGGS